MTKIKISQNRKIALIGLVSLIAIGVGVFAYFQFFSSKESVVSSELKGEDIINLSPPTDEELSAGDTQKDKILNSNNNSQIPTENSGKKQVTVLITDAGQYDTAIEVRSFIPDHFEDGVCTITFTKGELKIQKSVPAFKDSSTTICTNPDVAKADFSELGEWIVKVTYDSHSAHGESATRNIIIE